MASSVGCKAADNVARRVVLLLNDNEEDLDMSQSECMCSGCGLLRSGVRLCGNEEVNSNVQGVVGQHIALARAREQVGVRDKCCWGMMRCECSRNRDCEARGAGAGCAERKTNVGTTLRK